jgi:hypothetical protein
MTRDDAVKTRNSARVDEHANKLARATTPLIETKAGEGTEKEREKEKERERERDMGVGR